MSTVYCRSTPPQVFCTNVIGCVNKNLTKIANDQPSDLVNFCAAVDVCVNDELYNISQGSTSALTNFPGAVLAYLKSISGYTISDDIFLSSSGGIIEWVTGGSSGNVNIYNSDGTTTGPRVVSLSNTLSFNGNYVGIDTSYPTSKLTIQTDAITTSTQVDANGLLLSNTTTATSSGNLLSPPIVQSVYGWKSFGSSSQKVEFSTDILGYTGLSAATGYYRISSSVNGSAYSNIFRINNSGTVSGLVYGSIANLLNIGGTPIGIPAASGTSNMAWGIDSLKHLTSGAYNIGIGQNSLNANIIGSENIAIGLNALIYTTTDYNTAVGSQALSANTSGNSLTAVGKNALLSNTLAIKNTAVGAGSMENTTTGGFNSGVGEDVMLHNITGEGNVAMGWLAGSLATAGNYNVSLGWSSARSVSGGDENIFIGYSAGYLDAMAVNNQLATVTNSIVIGANAYSTADNQTVIGNDATTETNLRGQLKLNEYGSGTYTGTAAYTLAVDSSGNVIETSGGSGSVHINDLLLATGTNDINNAAYNQTWRWNSLTSGTGLMLSSSSIQDGQIFSIASTSTDYPDAISTGNLAILSQITSSGAQSNSFYSVAGLYIDVTNTGTLGTNTGLRINSSGGAFNFGVSITASGGGGVAMEVVEGIVSLGSSSQTGWLRMNGSTSGVLDVRVPDSFTNWTLTLPSDDGTSGQFLQTDGSGNTSWQTISGTGTVTSVGLSLPAIFSVSGSPVTTSGTLTGTLATQSANKVFAGPTTGSAAAPTFRSLVTADVTGLLTLQSILDTQSNYATLTTDNIIDCNGHILSFGDGGLSVALTLDSTTGTTTIGGTNIYFSSSVPGHVYFGNINQLTTANRLFGWYGSTGEVGYVSIGSGLSLSGGTLTATGSGGTVTSVSGTTNRITSTGGTTPVIDISASYVGQSSITTLGTVTTGTLSTGAVIGGVTMTLGSDASYDMYYRNSSGILTRLANGTTGQVLTATTSNAPSWASPAGGGLTVGTTTIASGTTTRILYDNSGVLGEYTVTGSGTTAVLSTTPTFTTSIIDPLVVGSTSANGTLTLTGNNSSSGNTAGNDNVLIKTGNSSGTTAASFFNDGSHYVYKGLKVTGDLGTFTGYGLEFRTTSSSQTYIAAYNRTGGQYMNLNIEALTMTLKSSTFSSGLTTLTLSAGKVGVAATTSPTAWLDLAPGTATANTAPLKFESGTNLTSPEAGAMEFNGTNLFFTPSATRNNILMTASVNSVSPTSPNRTITVVIDGTTYYIAAKTTND